MIPRKKIESTLIDMGCPTSICGFNYMVEAVMLLGEHEKEGIKFLWLYYEIAKKNNSTWQRVARGIRYALKIIRDTGNQELANHYIGFQKQSNRDSLTLLLQRLRQEDNEDLT